MWIFIYHLHVIFLHGLMMLPLRAKDHLTKTQDQAWEAFFLVIDQHYPRDSQSIQAFAVWYQRAPCKLAKEGSNQEFHSTVMAMKHYTDEHDTITLQVQ